MASAQVERAPRALTRADAIFCLVCACVLAELAYVLNGHLNFNLLDESFLWYGVVHTNAGEIPLRDFRSYDPGRYYWCAAWSRVLGDGVLAVRIACAVFGAIGVTFGLLAARRVLANKIGLAVLGAALTVWIQPYYKVFECGTAMIGVWIAVRLVESPTVRRHAAAGVYVGLAAFFGRNLGAYAGLALALTSLYTGWKLGFAGWPRRLAALAAGTAAGYAPMIALIEFAPGFRGAFIDSIAFFLQQSELNVALPVPWPWRASTSGVSFEAAARNLSIGVLFAMFVAVYGVALITVLRTPRERVAERALLIAALFIGAFWAHHASVRSDFLHLAQTVHPLLLATLALAAALGRSRARIAMTAALVVLVTLTVFSAGTSSSARRRVRSLDADAWETVRVGGDELSLPRAEARSLTALVELIETRVPHDDAVWITPHFLGLYPLLGRRSPTWDIYPAWPASDALQDRMLSELEPVRWALADARGLAGEDAMKLVNTHPRVWAMLMRDFERVPTPGLAPSLFLLRRKG